MRPVDRLKWKVLDGEHAGVDTSRICSQKLSPKTNLYKMTKMLKGADIEAGEELSDFFPLTQVGQHSGRATRCSLVLLSRL